MAISIDPSGASTTRPTSSPSSWTATDPIVRAHASAAERDGRIADEVVEVLRLTGINRLLLPVEMGGIEAGVDDIMEIVGRIAMVDGSTAWCAVIGTGSNIFSGYLPAGGASWLFADPDQGNATMFAPAGTLTAQDGGGYRLSGRWPFTSNCLYSEWIGLGALDADERGPEQVLRVAFVHASDVTILETWESGGLQGTGSHDVLVHDVHVDADRCCVFNGRPWADGRLWRMPVVAVLFPLLASVPLGIARGALEEVARQARDGRSNRRGQVGDDPIALMELGTAATRLRGAAAGLREAVLEAHALAGWHEPITPDLRRSALLRRLRPTSPSSQRRRPTRSAAARTPTAAARSFVPSKTWRRRASTSCSPTSTAASWPRRWSASTCATPRTWSDRGRRDARWRPPCDQAGASGPICSTETMTSAGTPKRAAASRMASGFGAS